MIAMVALAAAVCVRNLLPVKAFLEPEDTAEATQRKKELNMMKKVKIKKRNENRFNTVGAFKGSAVVCVKRQCACRGNDQTATTKNSTASKLEYGGVYSS